VHNLEIVQHWCAISRSCNFCCMHKEPLEFPSCTKVRIVRNELLQLCSHHQCRGRYTQALAGASGKIANSEKIPSPRSGYGCREFPDLWSAPVQGITISERSQLSSIISSDTLSLLVHYVCKLHSCNLEIAQTSCAVSRLACNSKNAQHSLEIAQILRLCGTYILTAHW